jgi:hypothetical protein
MEETAKSTIPEVKETTEVKPPVASETKVPETVVSLKVPENYRLQASRVDEIVSYAKEQGLSATQAQALLDREHDAINKYDSVLEERFKDRQKAWVEELKKDQEFGKEYDENVKAIDSAISKYFDEATVDQFKKSGYLSLPGVAKGFLKLGKAMADDKKVESGVNKIPETPKTFDELSDRLFPGLKK